MNPSLNLDAIYEAKRLFNENITFFTYHPNNYSDLQLNELLNRNLTLFWTTMHQCLNLNDLIHQQFILHNQSYFIISTNQTILSHLQSLFTWCNQGRSTWFTNVFTLMYHHSWQEKVSIKLQKYLVPFLLLINCLSLILSITGIYRLCTLSGRSNHQKIMILMRYQSIIHSYIPATWSLLLWYCIFSLLWLLLIFGLNIITSNYLNIHISLHSHNFYCRLLTYIKNILKYIPIWLISLMLCDRAIGEYRNRYHIYTINKLYNQQDDQQNQLDPLNGYTNDQSINNQLSIPKSIYSCHGKSMDLNLCHLKMNPLYKRSYTSSFLSCCRDKSYFNCICYGLKQTSKDQCKQLNVKNDYVTSSKDINVNYIKLLNDLSHWNECGLSHIGGLVLFSIVTSIICLINTHLIWLYKIGKTTKRCVLSAGDAILLSVFYPYLLKVCHSILPHIITFSSLVLLSFIAIQKSRILYLHCCSNPHNIHQRRIDPKMIQSKSSIRKQTIFTEPTQLTICLGLMNLVFDFAEFIEWFYSKFTIPNYVQSFTQNMNPNLNLNHNITMNMTEQILLTLNTLNSSMLLTKSIDQMCSIQLTSGLLRIWSSQRFVFTLPILLCQSLKFRHLIQYYFIYYFQTLKMLHLCKISLKSQNYHNPSYMEDTLNTTVNLNTSIDENVNIECSEIKTTDDEEISSQHQHHPHHHQYLSHHHGQHQRQQQTITKSEDEDDKQRIPSLYCCSCINQMILSPGVNKDN
ncbi:unnamed protein product [Schistosoma rodhaini]|nr:unnamed protein product [Schistosoma rodhaini]